MLFSSTLFLFAFLPLVLALHFVAPRAARNGLLLFASLFFYAWGETWLVGLMLVSILANFGFGLWVERDLERRGKARGALACAVAFNLGLLVLFKYADWLWLSLAGALGVAAPTPLGSLVVEAAWARHMLLNQDGHLRLPLGISFFTFQALSYVVDVARRDVRAQRSLADFGLYIALFPQLIAGPIVRYRDIALQLRDRSVELTRFASGLRRFIVGLSKKVLIANSVGAVVDPIFAAPVDQLTPAVAWLGLAAYTLQLYFDFSGYSDMAIGLGRMLGFEFVENFDHPYVSRSLTEFWRRWHISLSTWFRDYLYIPLGGGRGPAWRTYCNLATVFLLCGLWHGAAWNFVLFGCHHGAILVIERMGFGRVLERLPRFARHLYLMFVVMLGWLLFRCEDVASLGSWYSALFGLQTGAPQWVYPSLYFESPAVLAMVAGIVGATPWVKTLTARWANSGVTPPRATLLAVDVCLLGVLVLAALELSASTFNPFIYFRF